MPQPREYIGWLLAGGVILLLYFYESRNSSLSTGNPPAAAIGPAEENFVDMDPSLND